MTFCKTTLYKMFIIMLISQRHAVKVIFIDY